MEMFINVHAAFLVKNKRVESVTKLIRILCLSRYSSASSDASHQIIKQWLHFVYSRYSKWRPAVTVHPTALSRIRLV